MNMEHTNGGKKILVKHFQWKSVNFSGSGVRQWIKCFIIFVLDQGDEGTTGQANSPFDSH